MFEKCKALKMVCVRKSSVIGVTLGFLIGLLLMKIISLLREFGVPKDKPLEDPVTDITFKRIKAQTNCKDKVLTRVVQRHGDYWVFHNYALAERWFHCYESVTYTTQGDYTFLDNVPTLAERWRGPISIAIYAPGSDLQAAADSVHYLRNCENPLVRRYVTFHLFFHADHFPKQIGFPLINLHPRPINCSYVPPYAKNAGHSTKQHIHSTYRSQHNLTYPINVARNIARENAQTHFVFASDIELYPSRYLINNFLEMVSRKSSLFSSSPPKVFTMPVFEIKEGVSVPDTKTNLLKLIKKKKAFPFHEQLCRVCHEIPMSKHWLEEKETSEMEVFAISKRTGSYRQWEAFYIGTNNDPLFDERLTWEGQSNKMTQGYIMCLLNYDYVILNNAFLVHKPGIKKKKTQLVKYGALVRQTNNLIKTVIKKEINSIYGENQNC